MRFHSDDLRKEAREIASQGKGARQAWADLRQWATKRGPAAARCAMMEFLGAYGGTPEAAFVMPEIMRNASQVFSPSERTELASLAQNRAPPSDLRPQIPMMGPKPAFPIASGRPALALSFRPSARGGVLPRPGTIEPITPAADHAYLRDMPVRMRERLVGAALKPPLIRGANESPAKARGEPQRLPQFGTGGGAMHLGANKGEHLVRHLIRSLRSHGRDEAPGLQPAPGGKQPKRRPKALAKRAGKRKAGRTRVRSLLRKPMKKGNAGKRISRNAAGPKPAKRRRRK